MNGIEEKIQPFLLKFSEKPINASVNGELNWKPENDAIARQVKDATLYGTTSGDYDWEGPTGVSCT